MRLVSLFVVGIICQQVDPSADKRLPLKYKKGDFKKSLKSSSSAGETSFTKEFYEQDRKTQQMLCRGLVEIDYSKASAVEILIRIMELIEVTGTIDEVESKLTVMLNMDKLEELKSTPNDTHLVRSPLFKRQKTFMNLLSDNLRTFK